MATPNPGSREVLAGGLYGRLVADEEFGETLCELLSDERARAEWSARGLERARQLSLEAMADGYESLMAELTAARVRGGARRWMVR